MAVEACPTPNLRDDVDEDDEPLVFKRSSSSASKQNQTNSETRKVSSQKRDGQSARQISDVRPANGESSSGQKGRMNPPAKPSQVKPPLSSSKGSTSSAKPSQVKSPLSSPKGSTSSAKPSQVKSPLPSPKVSTSSIKQSPVSSSTANSKPSSSGTDTPKPVNQQKIVTANKAEKSSPRRSSSETNNDSEDSDDGKPLRLRLSGSSTKGNSNLLSKEASKPEIEDSDDEKPLATRFPLKSGGGESISKSYDSGDNKPLAKKLQQNGSAVREGQANKSSNLSNKRPSGEVRSSNQSAVKKPKLSSGSSPTIKMQTSVKAEPKAEDDDDHLLISQRIKKSSTPISKSSSIKKETKVVSFSVKKVNKKSKKLMKKTNFSKSSTVPPGSGEGKKWDILVHNGVIFPPPYKPHGVKMLYKGKPVDLTPDQEEVATMFAVMLDTDYMNKPRFKENFFSDWKKILGKNHVIQNLEDCDFTPIYEWHQREKEKKKQMTTEEKKALKEEKLKQEEKYMWATVDENREKVGNFRVEPPGLFRGRGEHPKMGKLKNRIRPGDITINIGKDAPIPECPIPGESWKEVRHDNTVTWLAFWNDPINPKEFKYVFLAASSTLKGISDKEKYEKARLLKDYIQGIRAAYTKDFASKDPTKKQIAVATYLIDKLALRAGNEKDDDEADTVGCCTLKVENVEPVPPNILKFDFLGKDSIRYQNEVEVEAAVFKAIQQFRSGKKGSEDLFDRLDTSKLNAHLKELMPGLTAKVFRTYNASITLDDKLSRETNGGDVVEKVGIYQHANKEVAIICNHQRTVSKSHSAQMTRLNEKIEELKGVLEELESDLSRAKKGKPPLKSKNADGKSKRNLNPEALEKKIAQTNAKIEKMERDKETKEDLKTVALGTSKINYLDPRITVAWCKRHEVPIEKIFNKSLLAKFTWAMDVDPSFRF